MGAHYLCCLPLRLGVLMISGLQTLFTGACAGLLWFVLISERNEENYTKEMKIVTGVAAGVYTIICLFSLFGFIGAIIKKISYVSRYATLSAWLLGLQIGMAIFYIVLSFTQSKGKTINACIDGSTDQNRIDVCNRLTGSSYRVSLIISLLIPILFSAYGVYIISAYAKQLRQKENHHLVMNLQSDKGGYVPAGTYDAEDTRPLTHTYPYGDPSHSYGNTHANTAYAHGHV